MDIQGKLFKNAQQCNKDIPEWHVATHLKHVLTNMFLGKFF
jgi:hypothetical protein